MSSQVFSLQCGDAIDVDALDTVDNDLQAAINLSKETAAAEALARATEIEATPRLVMCRCLRMFHQV